MGDVIFQVTGDMLQLLQMKGLYRRLDDENTQKYLMYFMEVCEPFAFKSIT